MEQIDQHQLDKEKQYLRRSERDVDFVLCQFTSVVPKRKENEVDCHAQQVDKDCDQVDNHHGLRR